MGEALDRGMVLVLSLWDDTLVHMLWPVMGTHGGACLKCPSGKTRRYGTKPPRRVAAGRQDLDFWTPQPLGRGARRHSRCSLLFIPSRAGCIAKVRGSPVAVCMTLWLWEATILATMSLALACAHLRHSRAPGRRAGHTTARCVWRFSSLPRRDGIRWLVPLAYMLPMRWTVWR